MFPSPGPSETQAQTSMESSAVSWHQRPLAAQICGILYSDVGLWGRKTATETQVQALLSWQVPSGLFMREKEKAGELQRSHDLNWVL